jgi:hypothetical protein
MTNKGGHGPNNQYNMNQPSKYPGRVDWYRNGVPKSVTSTGWMSQYAVTPKNGNAPLRIGKRQPGDTYGYSGFVCKNILFVFVRYI